VSAFALKLVVGSFVSVLEAPPPADNVDKDGAEVGRPAIHDPQQFLKAFATLNAKSTFPGVGESPHDEQPAFVRVALDGGVLIFRRVLLMFC
jgi:hypothetical protein